MVYLAPFKQILLCISSFQIQLFSEMAHCPLTHTNTQMCMNVYTHAQFRSNTQHCFVYIYRRKSRKQPIKIHLLRFSPPLPLFGFLGRSRSFSSHWNHKSYLISPTEILIQCKTKEIELHLTVQFLFLSAWYTHLEAWSMESSGISLFSLLELLLQQFISCGFGPY